MKRRVLVRVRISTILLLLAVDSHCVSFVVVGDSLAMFQPDVVVFVVADIGLSTWGVRYCHCSCATGVRLLFFLIYMLQRPCHHLFFSFKSVFCGFL
ncbi:hypothetical protein [Chromohalobacter canadensis]|uniref:Secreted protein n=1 Tax=Chromohalobacter canadensis TaxID=141389 RepID=A0ABZ0Y7G2_9GAMM|nr:hypothetical protein [Chromohalobacter canadensis]MCK0769648.1 hypothetical protein [Chromohalobacter canadensis]WQH07668.1 hypothetical protein SR908_09130 [Chromohalobacter canadensis]